MVIDTDPRHLHPYAVYAAGEMQREIAQIPTRPLPQTIARRRRAGLASDKLFVSTGQLISGLDVVTDGKVWVIQPPPGRLSDAGIRDRFMRELRKMGAFRRIVERSKQALRRSVLKMVAIKKGIGR